MALNNTYKFILPLFAIGMIVVVSGCSSISIMQNQALPTTDTPAAESFGEYEVLMKSNFGKPASFRGQIDGPITVQTVLERSGAISKFRGMEITLGRVVEESGFPLKLPVGYSGSKKQVTPEQNYSIHPNDQILITPKNNNPLERVLGNVVR